MKTCALLAAAFLGGGSPDVAPVGQLPAIDTATPAQSAATFTFLGRDKAAPTPYKIVRGLIVFRVAVAGREVWAILDNGAQASFMDEAFARDAGLTLGLPAGEYLTPSGARLPSRRVFDVSLAVPGAFEARLPTVQALDTAVMSEHMGRKIDFVFGHDLVRHLVIQVSRSHGSFRMGPSGRVSAPPGVPLVPLLDGSALVEPRIGGKPVRLMIDLGSNSGVTLIPQAWERLGLGLETYPAARANADGRPQRVKTAMLPQINLGSVAVDAVEATIAPWAGIDVADGVLGMGVLGRYPFMIDIGQGKLWLLDKSPAAPPPAAK